MYFVSPDTVNFTQFSTLLLWVLVSASGINYFVLAFSAPGYVEAHLIKIDQFESFRHESFPNITNFSQKMSGASKPDEEEKRNVRKSPLTSNFDKRTMHKSGNKGNAKDINRSIALSKIPGGNKKRTKYHELEEDFDRSSNLSRAKSDNRTDRVSDIELSTGNIPNLYEDRPKHASKKSKLDKMGGNHKIIQSLNTQHMSEYFDTQNDEQRKKVFETIHERVQNSRMTVETDNDQDSPNMDFADKIDLNEEGNEKPQRHQKQSSMIEIELNEKDLASPGNNDGVIKSSDLYGMKKTTKHKKNISIIDDNFNNKNTEKEQYDNEHETEKVYDYSGSHNELQRNQSTSPKYNFDLDNPGQYEETINKGQMNESGEYKDNSTTVYPNDRAEYSKKDLSI